MSARKVSELLNAEARVRVLEEAIRAFMFNRGRHAGPHFKVIPPSFSTPTVESCAMCDLAYMDAELALDAVLKAAPDENTKERA